MRRKVTDLRLTAIHEAGHGVVAMCLGEKFTRVSIVPHGDSLGRIEMAAAVSRRATPDRIQRRLLVLAAGVLAESVLLGDVSEDVSQRMVAGGCSDIEASTALGQRVSGSSLSDDQRIVEAIERSHSDWTCLVALAWVRRSWQMIERGAEALLVHREMSGRAFRESCTGRPLKK